MRRGIKFRPTPVATKPLRICDYPVFYDTDFKKIASARGVFRKKIVVGPRYFILDENAGLAVLFHEAHHLRDQHKGRRLLATVCALAIMVWDFERGKEWIMALAHRQEYEADRFAKAKGYGLDLARALETLPEGRREEDRWFHPPLQERLRRLRESDDAALAA